MTEEIVRVEAISKEFLGVTALSNVNLRLNKGEIHGLVGENGAGKSTLINILAGAFRPSSGSLFISGKPVLEFQPSVAQSLGISVVYQETVLVPDFTAEENIWLGREDSRNLMIDKAGQKENRGIMRRIWNQRSLIRSDVILSRRGKKTRGNSPRLEHEC